METDRKSIVPTTSSYAMKTLIRNSAGSVVVVDTGFAERNQGRRIIRNSAG